MINQSTVDKLIEMRLTAMADAFSVQSEDDKYSLVPFEDRFGMLVDIEYTSRKNNRMKRLIKNAEFDQPEAHIAEINYTSGRKLDKDFINKLAGCEYISQYRNIFISGTTGSGKTYLACALGMEACKQFYTVKYIRLPDLLIELEAARSEGTFKKVIWLLLKPSINEQQDIFELLHRRRKKSSTIFCSQYRHEGWYDQLGGADSPLADGILDRIVHDAYKINIESLDPSKDISMREVYGMKE